MKKRLTLIDQYLSLWIILAMLFGTLLGKFLPSFTALVARSSQGSVNIPIAIGLILMMYPPLAAVQYEGLSKKLGGLLKPVAITLVINWIIGPIVMFFLAHYMLPEFSGYIRGLILVGIAPCIAMVLVWNNLASGHKELAAVLVALNSGLQIVLYSLYAWIFLVWFPDLLDFPKLDSVSIPVIEIAKSVGIYLGIPFLLGIVSRWLLIRAKSEVWFTTQYLPKVGKTTLVALLFTIVIMFSLQGNLLIDQPLSVVRVALPLVVYFLLLFGFSFWVGKKAGIRYDYSVAVAFTSAGNNFELGIAVCVATFGLSSPEAFASVIGPLVEVPVLLSLVKLVERWKY